MIKKISEIVQGYVEETNIDYVGLWQIILRVRHELGVFEREELKKIVLQIVRELLAAGLEAVTLSAAAPTRHGWQDQDVEYVLDRVSQEWDALGRDPNPGEIVWFDQKRG
jgi:hypothetical protein